MDGQSEDEHYYNHKARKFTSNFDPSDLEDSYDGVLKAL